jgi:hypothetical protein
VIEGAESDLSDFHELIAVYLEDQAAWRYEKATEYPDDARNKRSAHGLRELAAYVRGLPSNDERIIELGTIGVRDGLFSPPVVGGPDASHAISRFRFNNPLDDCDQFLTDLIPQVRADAIEQAYFAGVLERTE